ncbi:hypothetical protein G7B40_016075 [Aetokthonos hydrillicola Thurmond2011]|jgi:predicted nucleic-acid-binding protein|uniref:Transposase n=1 Tax=Aetokthonos hydrillicola Thurmond2011 TaxID=2712845 RepID=A0AAP5IBK9_9CYAN|nr:hypothetical protein [Aetokthonos hydrillicola]MDR9896070.1 hypothetical protein [Aetokthonos hydrillicola Thurmond2011]
MKSVEKHVMKKSHEWYSYCAEITSLSRCLYNTIQYNQRQGYFYGYKPLNLSQLDKGFKDNENYKKLPAKVAQLVLKQNVDAWNSYYLALEAYNQDKSKFTGKPKIPSFITKKHNLIKFNNQAIGKKEFNKGFVVPSMSPIRIPVKPGMKFEDICEVRIIPKVGCFVVEIIYESQWLVDVLEKILRADAFDFENREAAWWAVQQMKTHKTDFSDFLMTKINQQAGCNETVTFDAKLQKLEGIRLLST